MNEWPDIEVELVAWLAAATDTVVTAELPADLDSILPVVQVQRAGGDDDTFRLDRALVDIDVYAASRGDASALARQIRVLLLGQLRGSATAAAVFGRVATVSAPSWRPYENVNLRRCGATYEIYLHPVS
jgi:hypothetical protein